MGKLLKIKFHWEPKLLLEVNKFLPKSWNSLSLSHEEFPSSFCHTCCTSDWLPLCIFFFQFKLKLVSEWVSEGVSSHFHRRYWTREKFGVFYYVNRIFFSVLNLYFICWPYFIFRTLLPCFRPSQTAGNVNFSWRCMKYLSNLSIANHIKAPFAICITVFVASCMANG